MENPPKSLKEHTEFAKEKGAVKMILFNLVYIWSLFAISVGAIMFYNWVFPIDFNTVEAIAIVASIFGIITSVDFILLYYEKITLVIVAWVALIAIPLALYMLFVGSELLKIDNKNIAFKVREQIFHRKKFC